MYEVKHLSGGAGDVAMFSGKLFLSSPFHNSQFSFPDPF